MLCCARMHVSLELLLLLPCRALAAGCMFARHAVKISRRCAMAAWLRGYNSARQTGLSFAPAPAVCAAYLIHHAWPARASQYPSIYLYCSQNHTFNMGWFRYAMNKEPALVGSAVVACVGLALPLVIPSIRKSMGSDVSNYYGNIEQNAVCAALYA